RPLVTLYPPRAHETIFENGLERISIPSTSRRHNIDVPKDAEKFFPLPEFQMACQVIHFPYGHAVTPSEGNHVIQCRLRTGTDRGIPACFPPHTFNLKQAE